MFYLKNVKYKNILSIDNLKIDDKKIIMVKGKSGSGKSTLLKLLNNIISSDSGEILYKGVDINSLNPIKLRQEVIMQSQFPSIYEGSIRDNLNIIFELRNENKKSDKNLDLVLKIVDLNKSLDNSSSELSGGEKTRLSIARLFLVEPEVFLLDEPCSSLDSKTERKIMVNIINEIKSRNKTLIFITHSENCDDLAEEIITLENGRILKNECK